MSTHDTNTFSQLPWHDSELLEVRVGYGSSLRPTIALDVAFVEGNNMRRSEILFNDARGVYVDVDLLAKELCGNQIASGHCKVADESTDKFVARLQDRFDLYPGETMTGLFLFMIELIHPGGIILVLARSFSEQEFLRSPIRQTHLESFDDKS
jgi:hypothetical protein